MNVGCYGYIYWFIDLHLGLVLTVPMYPRLIVGPLVPVMGIWQCASFGNVVDK